MKRNYGIDLLKIFSMLLVCMAHILNDGQLIYYAYLNHGSFGLDLIWIFNMLPLCSVNCYALISGYVGVDSKYKYSSILKLWCEVSFYSILITVLFSIFSPSLVGTQEILNAIFPVLTKSYWYFTAYFCLFFFKPFINKLINSLDEKQLITLLVTIIMIFSVTSLFTEDIFYIDKGFTTLWIILLYIIGACIKKTSYFEKKSTYFYITVLSVSITASYFLRKTKLFNRKIVEIASPTMLIASVALLILFSRINFDGKFKSIKVVSFLSTFTFGIYLIQTQPLIYENIFKEGFMFEEKFGMTKVILIFFAASFGIYIVCNIIDMIRYYLFKLLHINQICEKIDKRIKIAENNDTVISNKTTKKLQKTAKH